MLGKRSTRIYTENSAIEPYKIQKVQKISDQVSSQTTNVSQKCTSLQIQPSNQEEQKTSEGSCFAKKELVLEMLSLLIDEFNCNHSTDIDQQEGITVYSRDTEKQQIKKFITSNIDNKKSGLLYLCGHPGTGKTSTLNIVLQEMKHNIHTNLLNKIEVFMHNAMTYNDVKSYQIQLVNELNTRLNGSQAKNKINRPEINDDELSNLIAKVLRGSSSIHKILVIDEIDTFQSQEKYFLQLAKSVLQQSTNTTIVGIANSVDIPFKKKHSALALRDAQLLFKPYSTEQLVSIMEEKQNMKFQELPMKLRSPDLKNLFFNLIDEKAMELIAKKVSLYNGDIRIAFDLIKTSISKIFQKIKGQEDLPKDSEIRVTYDLVLKVFDEKYGSKVFEILSSLNRQDIVVLEALSTLLQSIGEERKISFLQLFEETYKECKSKCLAKVSQSEFINILTELQFYNLIQTDKSKRDKKDIKITKITLQVDLQELDNELSKLEQMRKGKDICNEVTNITIVDLDTSSQFNNIGSNYNSSHEGGNTKVRDYILLDK